MLIYKITCSVNDKIYIGATTRTAEKRFKEHLSCKKSTRNKFHKAIIEYGKENFSIEIIEDSIVSLDVLNEREEYWIAFYDSVNLGYNTTFGVNIKNFGNQNREIKRVVPDETKKKMSECHWSKKYPEEFARNQQKIKEINAAKSEEDKKLVSQNKSIASKKVWDTMTPERKAEIIISRSGENNSRFGVSRTDEVKEKIKDSFKKRKEEVLIECPFCGFCGSSLFMMKRWHFDNCNGNRNEKRRKRLEKSKTDASDN